MLTPTSEDLNLPDKQHNAAMSPWVHTVILTVAIVAFWLGVLYGIFTLIVGG